MKRTHYVCTVVGCERQHKARGLCARHYARARERGTAMPRGPIREYKRRATVCSVDGCLQSHVSGGFCSKHYQRWYTHGDPLHETRKSPGERTRNRQGYVVLHGIKHPNAEKRGSAILEHRYVMALHLSRPLLPTESVHHRNGDRTDNRIENLELWCSTQPSGQRVDDLVVWAREILGRYT